MGNSGESWTGDGWAASPAAGTPPFNPAALARAARPVIPAAASAVGSDDQTVADVLRSGPMSVDVIADAQIRADAWWAKLNDRQRAALNCESRELLVAGGTRQGKSVLLQLLCVWWSTGVYPSEYRGLRAPGPVPILCLGETQVTTRDTFQEPIFGMVDRERRVLVSTGITREGEESLLSAEWMHFGNHAIRTSGLLQLAFIRHRDGGASTIMFGTYGERQRARKGYNFWAALIDESGGGLKGYMEVIGRLVKTRGPARIAWCPVIMSDEEDALYDYFDRSTDPAARLLMRYRVDEATHLGAETIQAQIRQLSGTAEGPPRLWGMKAVVGGKTFGSLDDCMFSDSDLLINNARRAIIGTDLPHTLGAFAGVKVLWDEDADIVWVVGEYQSTGRARKDNSEALIAQLGGGKIPVAWPHDGARASTVGKAGDSIVDDYRSDGVNMLAFSAAYENRDGTRSNSVRRAILDMRERMTAKRVRLNRLLTPLLVSQLEMHRIDKDGKPVKGPDDHLVDALFKALMSLRHSDAIGDVPGVLRTMSGSFNYYPASAGRSADDDVAYGFPGTLVPIGGVRSKRLERSDAWARALLGGRKSRRI